MGTFTNIDVSRLRELQGTPDLLLVDVRTEQEVSRGVIPGARHVPLHMLPMRLDEFANAEVVVFYCQSGARSAQASAFVSGKGPREVYNLAGGIAAWAVKGLPLASL